ncbi:AmpG permease [uncultured Gammaproteobacteria bacterium]|uniref:AmpG family muropeptide MFS transporter n=1 Tax=Bathymodiolus heckerae thiotrophic gill symbiont TaxID=1052212 RepID=UPI0010BA6C5C|nr:MFS transporter [Bathymodiolus heckerae thiotrophic gill symbiont]CAC9437771.1 AmpG permease [uncultured Gammaproteobacteria bacterium]SMN13032.1 AmpG permease [Bathymodiolus heckerae thiotrophic gill symbiont]
MNKLLETYLDKRMLFIFLNGIASGFPWVIIGSAMTLWLKDAGLTRTAIGFFGSVFFVYSINWLWAPLLDRVKIPVLTKRFGQRRSWLLLLQSLLFLLIILISFTDPKDNLIWVSLLALSVAIVSSTQDVVIDAYRIEVMDISEKDKLPATAAMATSGWWVGYGLLGAIALYLSDFGQEWTSVYLMISVFVLGFILNTLCLNEPESRRQVVQEKAQQDYENLLGGHHLWQKTSAWFLSTLVEPLKDFFLRFGKTALIILLFIMFFKIGEAFLGRMSLVFYKEIGFTTAEIATYSKLIGSTLTIVFSIIASVITVHYGLVRGLMISGVAMASTNLIFSYLAFVGPDTNVFAVAILLDNFTAAFSTVAFVAFISHLTNRAYTATQYALMASAGNFGRTLFAGGSGWMVDSLEMQEWAANFGGPWVVFFAITALMVIPSLIMLYWISRKFKGLFV